MQLLRLLCALALVSLPACNDGPSSGADTGLDGARLDGGIDGGGIDAPLPDGSLPDAGVDARSFRDGGPAPDAFYPPLPGTMVVVNLREAAFPAWTHKLGINEEWTEADAADFDGMRIASGAGAPMAAGLVETNTLSTALGPNSTVGPDPLFSRTGGVVSTRSDADLDALRAAVDDGGMINLLQLAGTPVEGGVFAVDGDLTDPRTCDVGCGNWYPLPLPDAPTDELANAFGSLSRSIRAAGGPPTFWALWQEPDHTIGLNLGRITALNRYARFFTVASDAIRAGDPDAVMVGIQQNSSAGLNGGTGRLDGADYGVFVQEALLPLETVLGHRVVYDYITLQNYKAERSEEIVANSRLAYGDRRFSSMPLLMNEVDYGAGAFDPRYNDRAGLIDFLDVVLTVLDEPDVAYALLTRNLYSRSTLALEVVRMLDGMPALRRPTTVEGPGAADITAIAGATAQGFRVLAANRADSTRTLSIDLRGLDGALVSGGSEAVLSLLDGAAPVEIARVALDMERVSVLDIAVPSHGIVMLEVGIAPETRGITRARYARHRQWVPRTGTIDAPLGQGHYEVRTDRLITSVAGAGGVGLAGVVLREVPASSYSLRARIDASGVPESSASGVILLRLDYLSGETSVGTRVVRALGHRGSDDTATTTDWLTPASATTREAPMADGDLITLDVSADAPAGWATADGGARRVMVSLLVEGFAEPATVVATLNDTP